MKQILPILIAALMMGCFKGEQGAVGLTGPAGPTLNVKEVTGTILSQNYTVGNPSYASIYVSPISPTILFVGIENSNGVYVNTTFNSIVYSAGTDNYGYGSNNGYYIAISDPSKLILQQNYKIQYVND